MTSPSGDLQSITVSPATRRRQRIRQSILDAAERVFAEQGEAGLSIRRLAEEIDYSPSAIYKYFESKQHLVDELKEAFFARLLDDIDTSPKDGEPFLEHARRCMISYIRIALERPHHYAAAFSGQAEIVEIVTDCAEPTKKQQAFAILLGMVEQGVSASVFRKDIDPYLAAKSLWASSHGLAVLMSHIPHLATGFTVGPKHTDARMMEAHADIAIGGLLA